jgi:hypothetical protein
MTLSFAHFAKQALPYVLPDAVHTGSYSVGHGQAAGLLLLLLLDVLGLVLDCAADMLSVGPLPADVG